MNRTCYDIGILFYCCIFVTIMGVLGRPISVDFLRASLANKHGFVDLPDSLYSGERTSFSEELSSSISSDFMPFFASSRTGSGSSVSRYMDGPRSNVSKTPEYMLELYNKLSKKKPFLHNSNIIRSFVNLPHLDVSGNSTVSDGVRVHSLTFNISTLAHQEILNLAELRLYTLITQDQKSFVGVRRFVSVFEVLTITHDHRTRVKHNYITSKYILSVDNAWERFDVTSAVKRSMKEGSTIERLEVRIRSLFRPQPSDNPDFNSDPNDAKQPILVVYSDDKSARHEHAVERHELIVQGIASAPELNFQHSTPLSDYSDNMYRDTFPRGNHQRVKRSRLRNSICQRRPMYVNFDDLGFDWIIAPRGYQAYQCAGRCYFPLSDSMNPTKHSIIQLLMHKIKPTRATRICCVPTELKSISLLYKDEYGVTTFKYRYDGMVVTQCGCR